MPLGQCVGAVSTVPSGRVAASALHACVGAFLFWSMLPASQWRDLSRIAVLTAAVGWCESQGQRDLLPVDAPEMRRRCVAQPCHPYAAVQVT